MIMEAIATQVKLMDLALDDRSLAATELATAATTLSGRLFGGAWRIGNGGRSGLQVNSAGKR